MDVACGDLLPHVLILPCIPARDMHTVRHYEVISTLVCLSEAQMHDAGARVDDATLLCISDAHTAGLVLRS